MLPQHKPPPFTPPPLLCQAFSVLNSAAKQCGEFATQAKVTPAGLGKRGERVAKHTGEICTGLAGQSGTVPGTGTGIRFVGLPVAMAAAGNARWPRGACWMWLDVAGCGS